MARLNEMDIGGATNLSLILTNVQLINAGSYVVVVTDSSGSVTSRVARLEVDPTFTKITSGDIVNDSATFTGCAWGDFNNDGFLDLFVSKWGSNTNVLYRNNGDGTFDKATQGDPVMDRGYHTGAAWGDFDNDGFLDVVVADGGGGAQPARELPLSEQWRRHVGPRQPQRAD